MTDAIPRLAVRIAKAVRRLFAILHDVVTGRL